MLAFTLSLDDLVIASFTSGPGATTLPMKIYSQVRLGVTPEINAVCTILIARRRGRRHHRLDRQQAARGAAPARRAGRAARLSVIRLEAGRATAADAERARSYSPETPRLIGEMNGVLHVPPTKKDDWSGPAGRSSASPPGPAG